MPPPPATPPQSYWCHGCSRLVCGRPTAVACPGCGSGFIEEAPRRRSPAPAYDLYYSEGPGEALRPLPAAVSDLLMASGFDRLLDQMIQMGAAAAAGGGRPASKAAVDALPTVAVSPGRDCCCAVCREVLDAEATEMPCGHLYHRNCILPWLALRNSCPLCRHRMPADEAPPPISPHEGVTLTISIVPGGGFEIGTLAGAPRRVALPRNSRGIRRAIRGFLSLFRRSSSLAAAERDRRGPIVIPRSGQDDRMVARM